MVSTNSSTLILSFASSLIYQNKLLWPLINRFISLLCSVIRNGKVYWSLFVSQRILGEHLPVQRILRTCLWRESMFLCWMPDKSPFRETERDLVSIPRIETDIRAWQTAWNETLLSNSKTRVKLNARDAGGARVANVISVSFASLATFALKVLSPRKCHSVQSVSSARCAELSEASVPFFLLVPACLFRAVFASFEKAVPAMRTEYRFLWLFWRRSFLLPIDSIIL